MLFRSHTTHTPGPWHVAGDTAFDCSIRIIPSFPKGPACIAHAMATVPATTAHANARLIAAAPELLAALESCQEIMTRAFLNGLPIGQGTFCEEQDWNTANKAARAAIRKANGGVQ